MSSYRVISIERIHIYGIEFIFARELKQIIQSSSDIWLR